MSSPSIETAVPVSVTTMEKQYEGEVSGRSFTLFTAAVDQAADTGTYVAMESFGGVLHGTAGTFNFAYAGTGREAEFFVIVPGSGTGALARISGGGGIGVDAHGTHRIWFDYDLG